MKKRADLQFCPVKKEVIHPDTKRVQKMKPCGARMHHYDDHSECPKCGFFLKKDQIYNPVTRETSTVRKLK